MNKIIIDTKLLGEDEFNYLKHIFVKPKFKGNSLDKLYSYLYKLKDTEIIINNSDSINEKASNILRVINDVYNDHHNFNLTYDLNDEHNNKVILDIVELNKNGHDYLTELFDFPDYYGKNLDALYDCASELNDTEIIIINMDEINEASLKIISVLDDVADEYNNLKISYEYDEID